MTAVEEAADAEPRSFAEAYRRRLSDGWVEDASQQSAVAQMSRLLGELRREGGRAPAGLYLHGPVGRGKSQLLNLFMQYVAPVPAYRTHMHAFMGQVHARLHGLKGGDPIKLLSKEMAGEFRVLGVERHERAVGRALARREDWEVPWKLLRRIRSPRPRIQVLRQSFDHNPGRSVKPA